MSSIGADDHTISKSEDKYPHLRISNMRGSYTTIARDTTMYERGSHAVGDEWRGQQRTDDLTGENAFTLKKNSRLRI